MSKNNENDNTQGRLTKATICAVILVLCCTVFGAWLQWGYHEQASGRSAQFEQWSKNEIKNGCISLGKPSKAECTYQAKRVAQENERAEYDLYAQRTSALWAGVMAIAALVGIGLSGVGVFLVWTTFQETRKSNDLTKQALMEAEEASKLHLEILPAASFNGANGSCRVNLINHGPLAIARWDMNTKLTIEETELQEQVLATSVADSQETIPAGNEYQIQYALPDWPTNDISSLAGKKMTIRVIGLYVDVRGREFPVDREFAAVPSMQDDPGYANQSANYHFKSGDPDRNARTPLP